MCALGQFLFIVVTCICLWLATSFHPFQVDTFKTLLSIVLHFFDFFPLLTSFFVTAAEKDNRESWLSTLTLPVVGCLLHAHLLVPFISYALGFVASEIDIQLSEGVRDKRNLAATETVALITRHRESCAETYLPTPAHRGRELIYIQWNCWTHCPG